MDAVDSCFMVFRLSVSHQESEPIKKPPFPIRSGGQYLNRGDFCCSVLSNRTSLEFSSSKPPWEILQFLGRHPEAVEGHRNS